MCWAGLEALSPSSRARSSPAQARPKPGPDEGLEWAQAWLEISEAQAWGSSPGFNILWLGALTLTRKVGGIFSLLEQTTWTVELLRIQSSIALLEFGRLVSGVKSQFLAPVLSSRVCKVPSVNVQYYPFFGSSCPSSIYSTIDILHHATVAKLASIRTILAIVACND